MGIISSRAFLRKQYPPRTCEIHPRRKIQPLTEADRLVRDELRKEVQRSLHNQRRKTCNCLPFLQITFKGLQQKDVRSVLPMEENQVSRDGNDGWTTKLLRVGSH